MEGDLPGESRANRNLGDTYKSVRDSAKVIKCYEKSLYIVREVYDLRNTNECSFKSTIPHYAFARFCFDVCGYRI